MMAGETAPIGKKKRLSLAQEQQAKISGIRRQNSLLTVQNYSPPNTICALPHAASCSAPRFLILPLEIYFHAVPVVYRPPRAGLQGTDSANFLRDCPPLNQGEETTTTRAGDNNGDDGLSHCSRQSASRCSLSIYFLTRPLRMRNAGSAVPTQPASWLSRRNLSPARRCRQPVRLWKKSCRNAALRGSGTNAL